MKQNITVLQKRLLSNQSEITIVISEIDFNNVIFKKTKHIIGN
jgi:hypothetical protein